MALREFFAERYDITLYEHDGVVTAEQGGDEDAVPPITLQDRWTLQYITITRIQPLLEALDEDFSAYITVREVNAFTRVRPPGWR